MDMDLDADLIVDMNMDRDKNNIERNHHPVDLEKEELEVGSTRMDDSL
jgi:hypothetical protein